MPLTRFVRRVGGSLVVGVPSHFAECLDLTPRDSLSIEMQDKKIIMTPIASPSAKIADATGEVENTPQVRST